MTEAEYEPWLVAQLEAYAAEMVASGALDAEAAQATSAQQHAEFLPAGLATMLAAEQVARDEGWTAIELNVFGTNHRARALYDSLGYSVVSTLMTKSLIG